MKVSKRAVVTIEITLDGNEAAILASFLRRYRAEPKDILIDRFTERLSEAAEYVEVEA
jgi:hypothetical protein